MLEQSLLTAKNESALLAIYTTKLNSTTSKPCLYKKTKNELELLSYN